VLHDEDLVIDCCDVMAELVRVLYDQLTSSLPVWSKEQRDRTGRDRAREQIRIDGERSQQY
jgi:hypothetical protein